MAINMRITGIFIDLVDSEGGGEEGPSTLVDF